MSCIITVTLNKKYRRRILKCLQLSFSTLKTNRVKENAIVLFATPRVLKLMQVFHQSNEVTAPSLWFLLLL